MDSFKDVNVNASLEEAKKLIGERKFINADEVLERVLFSDRENSEAYLLKLVIDLQLTSVDELKDQLEPLESRINYQRAYEFADEKQRAKLNKINEEIKKNAGQADLARQYNLAMNYKSDGRYQEAEQVFNQILEYKDAKAQAAECLKQVQSSIYQKAIDAKQSRDYDEAISLFEKIIDYSDSKAQLKECRETIAASTYERAMQLKEEKHYDRAIPYFQKISGYKDADEQVKACERLQEEARQEAIYVTCLFTGEIDPYKHASKLKESCTKLATIPGYKDADQLLAKYQNILDEYEKELERKREEKAKARAKAKKKAKKVAIFTAIGAALITAGLLLTFLYFVPENRQTTWQKRANDASTRDDYQQIIDEIGDTNYGDSNNLVEMCNAGIDFEAGRVESGIDRIMKIGGTVDVEYDGNGGTPQKSNETIKPQAKWINTDSTKLGYDFHEWVLKSGDYSIDTAKHYASLKLTASYDIHYYDIVYNLDGGTLANKPTKHTIVGAVSVPNPTKEGYTFAGWTVNNNQSSLKTNYSVPAEPGDWELKANWTANTYKWTISDLNGGTADKTTSNVKYDEPYSITIPTRVGYTFVRFVVVKNGVETTETIPTSGTWKYSSDYSLKAIWSANTNTQYKVNYYTQPVEGGDHNAYVLAQTETMRGTSDSSVTVTAKNIPGFTPEEASQRIQITPDGSKVVNFYYLRNSYTLTFVANGGTVTNGGSSANTISLKYEAPIPNTIAVNREDSTFDGWYTDVDQTTKFSKMPNQNTTVYAYYSEETKAGSFQYQLTNTSAKITGNNGLTGAVVVPQYINNKPVIEIGNNAFKNGASISSITLPETVTTIGASAFEGCSVLTAGPDLSNVTTIGNNAFKDCTHLTTITLGEPLTSIGNYAFANCISLLQLPDISGVTTIGNYAFDGCVSLSEIKGLNGCASLGEGILTACENLAKLTVSFQEVVEQFYIAQFFCNKTSIASSDKYYQVQTNTNTYRVPKKLKTIEYSGVGNIPAYLLYQLSSVETFLDSSESTTGIGTYAFYNCSALKDIPEMTLTTVGDYVFYNCSSLTKAPDLSQVVSVGTYAFYGNPSITTVSSDIIESVGAYAFANCSSLKTVSLNSAAIVGNYAFSGCSALTSASIPFKSDLTFYDYFGSTNSFEGSISKITYSASTRYVPAGLVSFDLKASTGTIAAGALYNCNQFTSLTIDSSVLTIGERALYNCSGLTSLSIPESVASLGASVAEGCINLKELTIPFTANSATSTSPIGVIFGTYSQSNSYSAYQNSSYYYIPNSLKKITVLGGTIGTKACANMINVTDIIIGESVTSIGDGAFSGCTSLTNLTMPKVFGETTTSNSKEYTYSGSWSVSNSQFSYSAYGTSTVDETVTFSTKGRVSLSYYVSATNYVTLTIFKNGAELYSITGSTSTQTATVEVKKDDVLTFRWHNSTSSYSRSAYVTMTLTKIVEGPLGKVFGTLSYDSSYPVTDAYSYTYYIPSSLKTVTITKEDVPNEAFKNCTSLTRVNLSNGITTIGERVFYNCSNLVAINSDNKVIIPSSVKKIGDYAFYGCAKIANVNIEGDTSTKIGDYAFSNCTSLCALSLEEGVVSIGSYAFYGDALLETVNIADESLLESIGDYAFYNDSLLSSWGSDAANTIIIPDNIKTIGDYAFGNLPLITDITVGVSATYVGDSAFTGCSHVVNLTMPALYQTSTSQSTNYQYSGTWSLSGSQFYYSGYGAYTREETIMFPLQGRVDLSYYISSTNYVTLTILKNGESMYSVSGSTSTRSASINVLKDDVLTLRWYNSSSSYSRSAYVTLNYFIKTATFNGPLGTVFGTNEYTGSYSVANSKTYYLPSSLKTVTITKENVPENAFKNCTSLTRVNISETATSIGAYAFENCTNLTSVNCESGVNIPDSYVTIGSYAFKECRAITSVTIGGTGETAIGNYAFYNCSMINTLTLKEGLKNIGSRAFTGNVSLLKVDAPSTLAYIGDYAFDGNTLLTSFVVADKSLLEIIGSYAFNGCPALAEFVFEGSSSLKTINSYAFYNNSLITKWGSDTADAIIIPEGTETIGAYAFANLPLIKEVKIADSVTSVGSHAFTGCSSITDFSMPKIYGSTTTSSSDYTYTGVWSLNGSQFYYSGLGTANREETITFAGAGTVNLSYYVSASSYVTLTIYKNGSSYVSASGSNYTSTKSTSISVVKGDVLLFRFYSSTTSYTRSAYVTLTFNQTYSGPFGTVFGNTSFAGSTQVDNYYIPSTLKTVSITKDGIPENAFKNYTSLERINISETATSIGNNAFYHCTSLEAMNSDSGVVIPASYTSIGDNAFYGCTAITNVSIGGGEGTNIGNSAFRYCSLLDGITLQEGIASIGSYVFADDPLLLTINIPASVTSIGSYAFSGDASLTSVTIPDGSLLQSIGDYAFFNNSAISNWGTETANMLKIPDGTKTIGAYAFGNLSLVKDIIIADTVTSVGDCAFTGCSSLTNLTMPKVFDAAGNSSFTYSGPWNYSSYFYYAGYGTATVEETVTILNSGQIDFNYYCSSSNYITVTILKNGVSLGSNSTNSSKALTTYVKYGDVLTLRWYNSSSSYSRTGYVYLTFTKDNAFGRIFDTDPYDESYADSVGTLKHYIPSSLKTISITKENIPANAFKDLTSLTRVNISEDCTSIGTSAFSGCTNLAAMNSDNGINIPASVETIGSSAFRSCTAITSVSIGGGDNTVINSYAFEDCNSLVSLSLGDNVTSIGSYAFDGCVLLAKVNSDTAGTIILPTGLNSMASYAFRNCVLFRSITFGPSFSSIQSNVFTGCTSIDSLCFSFDGTGWKNTIELALAFPDSISEISNIVVASGQTVPGYLFKDMTAIEKVTLPNTLITIGQYAFYGCSSLSKINSTETGKAIMPDSLSEISNSAFYGCSSLTNLDLGKALVTIGNNTFEGCSGLEKIVLPNTVTSIGSNAFKGCSNVEYFNSDEIGHLVVPSGCTTIRNGCFDGMSNITDVLVGDNVTSIENGVFCNMNGLVNITLPFLGTNIISASGNYASPLGYIFGCVTTGTGTESYSGYIYSGLIINSQKYWYKVPTSLRTVKVTIQTQIPSYAFYNCSMLTNIYLPNSVTSEGVYVYENCPAEVSKTVVPAISSPWDGTTVAKSFHSGDGTENDPYIIFDGNELKYLTNQVNSGTSYDNKYFALVCDINLNNYYVNPIGDNSANPFRGNIDGRGYAIKNFKVTGTSVCVGLFGWLGGSLDHINFANGTISATVSEYDHYHVGLVANLIDTGSISNINTSVSVASSGAGYYHYTGGIVGYMNGGSVTNCYSAANVSATGSTLLAHAGGIVGYANAGTISGCYSSGNITANGSAESYSRNGQIVGEKTDSVTVQNCYRDSSATLIRYNVSGKVYNTDGTSAATEVCMTALKDLWDLTKWDFSGVKPVLKTI